jgi:hypothetical protein
MTTLSEFRTRVRQRANMEGTQFVTDSEVDGYVNASAAELYDVLVSRFEDYYLQSTTATVASGSDSMPLPADFYKLRGVDVDIGGRYASLRSFNFTDRNEYDSDLQIFRRLAIRVRYRLQASGIKLAPSEQAPGSYRLWYIPRLETLVDDADTFDGINGWEEYVVVDAAIKCLQKEESSTTDLERQKAALLKRIEAMAANRDAGEPERLVGPRNGRTDWGW